MTEQSSPAYDASGPPEETILPAFMDDVIHEQYEQARARLSHLKRGQLRSLQSILRDASWVVGQAVDIDITRRLGQKPKDWPSNG